METTDPLKAMIATATDVYYYGDAGTEREWRQCRFCLAYAEGEVGSKPTPRHGEPCPVGDLEHICDDTCPANEYHERTHAPLALHAVSAPPLWEWICEQHPELDWPHDDCAGPGMPKSAQVKALTYQRDQARLEHQETRGTVAALKQELATLRSQEIPK